MQRVEARRLNAGDWRVLRDTRLAALRENPEAFLSTFEEVSQWTEDVWTALVARRAIAFVDDQPIGMVGWSWHDEGFLELIGLWVDPRHRGGPAAPALVRVVIEQLREHPQADLRLAVRAANERATAFYTKIGFVELRREPGPIGELIWMGLPAHDSASKPH